VGSPDSPLKVAALAYPALRRLLPFDDFRLRRNQRFQFSEKNRNLFTSLESAELLLGHQQAEPHPTLSLIAGMPPFHVGSNPFHD